MKISYDVQALPERKRALGKRSEEVLALIAFLATPKKNMVIEYSGPDAEKECKKKYDTIRGYRLANKLADVFDVYRADDKIVVIKTKKPGRPKAEPTEGGKKI